MHLYSYTMQFANRLPFSQHLVPRYSESPPSPRFGQKISSPKLCTKFPPLQVWRWCYITCSGWRSQVEVGTCVKDSDRLQEAACCSSSSSSNKLCPSEWCSNGRRSRRMRWCGQCLRARPHQHSSVDCHNDAFSSRCPETGGPGRDERRAHADTCPTSWYLLLTPQPGCFGTCIVREREIGQCQLRRQQLQPPKAKRRRRLCLLGSAGLVEKYCKLILMKSCGMVGHGKNRCIMLVAIRIISWILDLIQLLFPNLLTISG